MDIKLEVNHDKAEPYKRTIVSGSKNYYRLQGIFTDDWNDLNKFLIFPDFECSVAFSAEDIAVLPEGLIADEGILAFGVIGINNNGELRISTNLINLRIANGAREIDALPPSPDDSATWESYIGTIAQKYIEEIKTSVEDVVKNTSDKSTVGNIAVFDDTTGKLIKDGGKKISSLAPIASPTFTGTPKATTAAEGTNTTQLATTAFVEEATHYTASEEDSTTLLAAHGGLDAGYDIAGKDWKEIFSDMLLYTKPTISISGMTNNSVYKAGVSRNITFTVSVTKKSKDITAVNIYQGSTKTALTAQSGSQTKTLTLNGTANTSIAIKADCSDGKSVVTSSTLTAYFVNPIYVGAVSFAPTTAAEVTALTEKIVRKTSKMTYSTGNIATDSTKARFCFAYPKSYGVISKAVDGSGFDNTSAWGSPATVSDINGVDYYVYTYGVDNANSEMEFKFTFAN